MRFFKRHWPTILGVAGNLPSIWHGFIWLFDWGARVDLVVSKLHELGGIGAIIAWLINPPPWSIWPALVGGLVLIWWDSRRHRAEVISQFSRKPDTEIPVQQRPELKLTMLGGNVFIPDLPVGAPKKPLTAIAINAKIWNVGAPSVVTEWELVVSPQNNITPVIGQLTEIPDILRVGGVINSAVISAADDLYVKTRDSIVSMTPLEGTILFYVPLNQSVVLNPTTKLELSAKDVYEKKASAKKVMGDWMAL